MPFLKYSVRFLSLTQAQSKSQKFDLADPSVRLFAILGTTMSVNVATQECWSWLLSLLANIYHKTKFGEVSFEYERIQLVMCRFFVSKTCNQIVSHQMSENFL